MKKLKIYLETSIFNFYFAEDSKDKMEATIVLFDEIDQGKYEPYTSITVIDEINKAPEEKRQMLLNLISKYDIEVLNVDEKAITLADKYIEEGIIPLKYETDALHIAIATIEGFDIILSWNFQHIVKRKTILMTGLVNLKEGYKIIDIYSPQEVIDNESN